MRFNYIAYNKKNKKEEKHELRNRNLVGGGDHKYGKGRICQENEKGKNKSQNTLDKIMPSNPKKFPCPNVRFLIALLIY